MRARFPHLEDMSPYLDRDISDPRYAEIEAHLAACRECREEERDWRSMEAAFRTADLDLEVPPFQWQRIVARIQSGPSVVDWRHRLASFIRFALPTRRAVVAFAAFVAVVSLATFEYWKTRSEQRILAEIARYDAEWHTQFPSENPFRSYEEPLPSANPFEEFVRGSR